jgi:hypothetical protein
VTEFTTLFDGETPTGRHAMPRTYFGQSGHLALEVHDNDPAFEESRWAKGARCRRRNIRTREIA